MGGESKMPKMYIKLAFSASIDRFLKNQDDPSKNFDLANVVECFGSPDFCAFLQANQLNPNTTTDDFDSNAYDQSLRDLDTGIIDLDSKPPRNLRSDAYALLKSELKVGKIDCVHDDKSLQIFVDGIFQINLSSDVLNAIFVPGKPLFWSIGTIQITRSLLNWDYSPAIKYLTTSGHTKVVETRWHAKIAKKDMAEFYPVIDVKMDTKIKALS